MKHIILLVFLFLSILSVDAQTSKADQILGDWISSEKDVIVHIYKEKEYYFGKVIWFKNYDNDPKIDAIDDSKGLPEEQWLNTIVMRNFVFSENKWINGKIFMLKTGKTYDASVKMKDMNTLQLNGYVFLPIFRESAIFTRCHDVEKNMLLEGVKK
ncbi:DUF2147 domain-containing protein [Emticicia sp. SJ17W-69]|uniref:DUF2147 domain-containing protein n=1 Tax=Emticicia sp. SJ17W-69 TaxID=3421657 RepID=UPI003EC0E69F